VEHLVVHHLQDKQELHRPLAPLSLHMVVEEVEPLTQMLQLEHLDRVAVLVVVPPEVKLQVLEHRGKEMLVELALE